LWGPQYQSEAARQLGLALRSVVRYDQGERRVPEAVLDQLYGLLIKRHAEIGKLVGRIGRGDSALPKA
jgi:hypothetical protein